MNGADEPFFFVIIIIIIIIITYLGDHGDNVIKILRIYRISFLQNITVHILQSAIYQTPPFALQVSFWLKVGKAGPPQVELPKPLAK